jgi:hypothetical protein
MRDATKWLVAAAAAVGAVLVAGLQLKDLPHGFLATLVAFLGISAALVAVAFILYRAAGVLVAGYTIFGQIAGLVGEGNYEREMEHQERWNEKWDPRLSKFKAIKRRSMPSQLPGKWRRAIRRWYATAVIRATRVIEDIVIRRAKNEDLRVGTLISYLDLDTFYFTQGLATNINQLYGVLKKTDEEILSLRGETIGEDDEEAAEEAVTLEPADGPAVVITADYPGNAELLPSDDKSKAQLEKAEWRRDRLESATTVLIAFANQKLLEQRFRKLLLAILFGGAVVALGAGAFAAAPKLGKPQPISITQPTQVTIRVIGSSLGKLCPPGTLLQGVAVGGTWDEPLVVTDQAGTCPAQQITLDPSEAIAVPVLESASSASPTPSP